MKRFTIIILGVLLCSGYAAAQLVTGELEAAIITGRSQATADLVLRASGAGTTEFQLDPTNSYFYVNGHLIHYINSNSIEWGYDSDMEMRFGGNGAEALLIDASEDVWFWPNAASGVTKALNIRGRASGDTQRTLLIGISSGVADTALFDGVSNYKLDGNVVAQGNFNAVGDVEISGNISAYGNYFRVGTNAASGFGMQTQNMDTHLNIGGGNYDFRVRGDNEPYLLYGDASTDRFGIGTTPTYRLDVAANHASGYAASFFNDGATSTRLGIKIQCGEDYSGAQVWVDMFDGNGDFQANISDSGGGVGFDEISDKKVKSSIRPSELDAIDKVRKLKWYAYDIDGRHIDGGLVAQRVEDVLPDAVTTRTFTSATGTKSVMMIHGASVEKVYQQAVTQMAIEQSLQRRQIDYLKAQAIRAGWDMGSFPLQ